MPLSTRLGSTLAVALLTAGLAAPGWADTVVVHDKKGDGAGGATPGHGRIGDIGRVRVTHGAHRLEVRVLPARHGRLADYYTVWVDTDPTDPGPELAINQGIAAPDEVIVMLVDHFGSATGHIVCLPDTGHADLRHQVTRFSVPRRCLRDAAGVVPTRLRISVNSSTDEDGSADWAPSPFHWSRWIDSDAPPVRG